LKTLSKPPLLLACNITLEEDLQGRGWRCGATHRGGTKAVAIAGSVASSSMMRVTSEGVSVITHDDNVVVRLCLVSVESETRGK
jgi:hypothetical protein